MPTEKQVVAMVNGQGFTQVHEPGFVAFTREHPTDGRTQSLHVFWWGNPKHADAKGIPRAYLVISPGLVYGEGDRYRLPVVEWPDDPSARVPAAKQKIRPWKDVAAEFRRVFMTALDAPLEEGQAALAALGDRYKLT